MNNNYGLSFCGKEKEFTNHIKGSTKTIRGIKYLETICNICGRKKTSPLLGKRLLTDMKDFEYEKYIEGLKIASLPKIERKEKVKEIVYRAKRLAILDRLIKESPWYYH